MEKYEHKSYTIEDFCVRDKIKYFYGIHQTLVVYGKSMHKIIIRNIFPVGLEEFNSFCRNLSRRGGLSPSSSFEHFLLINFEHFPFQKW